MTSIALKDGACIHVDVQGEGRPIVFLHGWAMHGDMFRAQADHFSASHRVVLLDLRHHRHSLGNGKQPTIDLLSQDLRDVFTALDLSDAVCVGWSLGAMVLWGALADPAFSDRVSAIVSIDMSPRVSNENGWRLGRKQAEVPSGEKPTVRPTWEDMVQKFVPQIFAPGTEQSDRQLIERTIDGARCQDSKAMISLWKSMVAQDFRSALPEIGQKTLVTYGEKSQLYPVEMSAWVADAIPDAVLQGFANSGHAPHLEEPHLFNDRLEGFMEAL